MTKDKEKRKQMSEVRRKKKRIEKVKKADVLLKKLEKRAVTRRATMTMGIRRVFAVMIDWYLASVLAGIPVMLIYSIESGEATAASSLSAMSLKWGMIAGVLAIIAASTYYVCIPSFVYKGQTIGKKILGIKIINLDNSEVNLKNMLRREIIGVAIMEGGIVCTSEYIRQMIEIVSNYKVYSILGILGSVVTVISIIVLLATKEKRMIHDFIGKTKVVEVPRNKSVAV